MTRPRTSSGGSRNGDLAGNLQVAVVEIGTNNLGDGESVAYTVSAIEAVRRRDSSDLALDVQVVLMGLFPRDSSTDPIRGEVDRANADLAAWGRPRPGATFLDIDSELTAPDGSLSGDFPSGPAPPQRGRLRDLGRRAIEGVVLDLFDATRRSASAELPVPVVASGAASPFVGSTGASATISPSSSPGSDVRTRRAPAQTVPATIDTFLVDVNSPSSPASTEEPGAGDGSSQSRRQTTEAVTAAQETPVTTGRGSDSRWPTRCRTFISITSGRPSRSPTRQMTDRVADAASDDGPSSDAPAVEGEGDLLVPELPDHGGGSLFAEDSSMPIVCRAAGP